MILPGLLTAPYNTQYHYSAMIFAIIIKKVVPLFLGLIGVIGLVGNFLVILVVAANLEMRSSTNIFLINLAVADLLSIIFCIPSTISDYMLQHWPYGTVWCKIVAYLKVVNMYVSVYTLVLMSLDRYLAVVHPIGSRSWRTTKSTMLMISVVWVVVLGMLSAPVPVIYGEFHYTYKVNGLLTNGTICRTLAEYKWIHPFYRIFFFITSYFLPLILICFFYISILCKLRRIVPVSTERRRDKKRVTRLVFVVVGVFVVCWCPAQVILLGKSLGILYPFTRPKIYMQQIYMTLGSVLAFSHSCINPFLYAFLNENFRKAFKKLLYRRPRAEPNTTILAETTIQ